MNFLEKIIKNNTSKLILTAFLAFLAAYFALPARGLVSTLPLYVLIILISAAIRISVWQKAALFGIFAFIYTSIEYDFIHALGFSALCILTVFISSFAFKLFSKKKVFPAILSLILISACTFPHAYFFGNIIKGINANKIINNYVEERYSDEGSFVSHTYYDYKTDSYKADVYDSKAPTEIYSLSVRNIFLHDSYKQYAQKALMNSRMLEITTALREKYPDDNFEVIPIEISGYPFSEQINLSDTTDYNSKMRFKIIVCGLLNKQDFAEKSNGYYDTIMNSGIDFREIVFTGGGYFQNSFRISVSANPLIKDFYALAEPLPFRLCQKCELNIFK